MNEQYLQECLDCAKHIIKELRKKNEASEMAISVSDLVKYVREHHFISKNLDDEKSVVSAFAETMEHLDEDCATFEVAHFLYHCGQSNSDGVAH